MPRTEQTMTASRRSPFHGCSSASRRHRLRRRDAHARSDTLSEAEADGPPALPYHALQTYVRAVGGDWRDQFEYAWQAPDRDPDEALGLLWRETGANYSSGSSGSQPRGTVMLETSGLWVANVRLEDPRPRPASHRSPPWVDSTRWRRRRSPPTRCGRRGDPRLSPVRYALWSLAVASFCAPRAGVRGRGL